MQLVAGGVTAQFFDVLGVSPVHGRAFNRDEDMLGNHRVVLLGHDVWHDRFGGRPDIVGHTITLNGLPHQVIGVLGPSFEAPTLAKPTIWVPLVLRGGQEALPRASHYLSVFARMKPAVSLENARHEMDAIGKQLETEYPAQSRGHGAHAALLRDEILEPVSGVSPC